MTQHERLSDNLKQWLGKAKDTATANATLSLGSLAAAAIFGTSVVTTSTDAAAWGQVLDGLKNVGLNIVATAILERVGNRQDRVTLEAVTQELDAAATVNQEVQQELDGFVQQLLAADATLLHEVRELHESVVNFGDRHDEKLDRLIAQVQQLLDRATQQISQTTINTGGGSNISGNNTFSGLVQNFGGNNQVTIITNGYKEVIDDTEQRELLAEYYQQLRQQCGRIPLLQNHPDSYVSMHDAYVQLQAAERKDNEEPQSEYLRDDLLASRSSRKSLLHHTDHVVKTILLTLRGSLFFCLFLTVISLASTIVLTIRLYSRDIDATTLWSFAISLASSLFCIVLSMKWIRRDGLFRYGPMVVLTLMGVDLVLAPMSVAYYFSAYHPTDTDILIPDFEVVGSDSGNSELASAIGSYIQSRTANYPDVKVKPLHFVIGVRDGNEGGSSRAIAEGRLRKARMVIWGQVSNGLFYPHFEVIEPYKGASLIGPELNGQPRPIDPADNPAVFQLKVSREFAYVSLFTIGLTRYADGRWSEAISAFTDALNEEHQPVAALNQSAVYVFKGKSYLYQGRNLEGKDDDAATASYKQALSDFQALKAAATTRIDSDMITLTQALADFYTGEVYSALSNNQDAINSYTAAITVLRSAHDQSSDLSLKGVLNDNLFAAYYNRSLAHSTQAQQERYKGLLEAANQSFQGGLEDIAQAAQIKPGADISFARGCLYYAKGDYVLAAASYSETIRLNPENSLAYSNLSGLNTRTGNYTEAVALGDKAINLDKNNSAAFNNRGIALLHLGRLREAVSSFEKATDIHPSYAPTYYNLCIAYKNLADFNQAETNCNESIRLDGKDAEAFYNRAMLYEVIGRDKEAIGDYKMSTRLNPNIEDTPIRLEALYVRYFEQGNDFVAATNYDQAVSAYSVAITAQPDENITFVAKDQCDQLHGIQPVSSVVNPSRFAKVYYNRGYALAFNGKHELAAADFCRAIKLDPSHEKAYAELGIAFSMLYNYKDAVISFNQVVKMNPNKAETYMMLGQAYIGAGDKEMAVTSFNKVLELTQDAQLRKQAKARLRELGHEASSQAPR